MTLISCLCGCGTQFEEFDKNGRKRSYLKGHHTKGKKCPDISKRQTGKKNHMYGKISPLRGRKRPDLCNENANAWKGGRKLTLAKHNAKRRELFSFNPINSPQENFEGHHLNFNDVLFIPKELHKSIAHSVIQNRYMDEINNLAEEWYLKDQGVI